MKHSLEYLNSSSKRRLDVVGGVALSTLLLPPAVLTAIVSEINTSALNPILGQDRIGRDGQPIRVWKFRTLPKRLETEAIQTFGTFDPRASRLGMSMREMGIDEVPQLLNVLRGEMSLVGRRPLVTQDMDRLEDISPVLFKRWLSVCGGTRPGLTGPSQILRHGYKVTTDEIWRQAMELDVEYSRTASFRNDLKILGATPLKMLNARIHLVDNSLSETTEPEPLVESAPIYGSAA